MRSLLAIFVVVCLKLAIAGPSWTTTPAGQWSDKDGCFDRVSSLSCISANNNGGFQQLLGSGFQAKCLWCHSHSNSSKKFHPDHCAPLNAVTSGAYERDQMVCQYRGPSKHHKNGVVFGNDPTIPHPAMGNKNFRHGDRAKPVRHPQRQSGRWAPSTRGPQRMGGRHLLAEAQLLKGFAVEDPYGGMGKGGMGKGGMGMGKGGMGMGKGGMGMGMGNGTDDCMPTADNPLICYSNGLQFLGGFALGLVGLDPREVVECEGDIETVVTDVENAFSDFHLSPSSVANCVESLVDVIKQIPGIVENCGLEGVAEKIAEFVAKFATPIIGDAIAAGIIVLHAVDIFNDLDEAVHDISAGNWFGVGEDLGKVVSVVAGGGD